MKKAKKKQRGGLRGQPVKPSQTKYPMPIPMKGAC